jgi:hypothetical protein
MLKIIKNICLFVAFLPILPLNASDTTRPKHIFIFEKNSHFSSPRNLFSRFIKKPDTLQWLCRFDKTCCYNMPLTNGQYHEDQWDYNKLTGFTFTPSNPLNTTAMVGWRYNPNTHVFELVPYWHIHKKRLFDEKRFVTALPDEDIHITMIPNFEKNEVTVIIKTQKGVLTDTQKFKELAQRVSIIQPYFGGTSRAPNAMHLYCERLGNSEKVKKKSKTSIKNKQ